MERELGWVAEAELPDDSEREGILPNPHQLDRIWTEQSTALHHLTTVKHHQLFGSNGHVYRDRRSPGTFSYQWMAGATGSGVYTNLVVNGQISTVTSSNLTVSRACT